MRLSSLVGNVGVKSKSDDENQYSNCNSSCDIKCSKNDDCYWECMEFCTVNYTHDRSSRRSAHWVIL